ncbi:hypothetical protein [Modestobacter lapidis]|nr:hypothetical protein [Modestobacter lapidis]
MTRLTPRLKWRQAVTSDAFPKSERVVRGTLLCLVELMTPTGELKAWRDQMVEATGLPPRTVDRHLQRAVEAGWLTRETPAGKRRMAVYLATIPTDGPGSSVRHSWRADEEFCAPSTRVQNSSSVRHLVAHFNKEQSTHVSEYLAVDEHRGTRGAHDGACVSPPKGSAKSGSNGAEWLPTPVAEAGEVA